MVLALSMWSTFLLFLTFHCPCLMTRLSSSRLPPVTSLPCLCPPAILPRHHNHPPPPLTLPSHKIKGPIVIQLPPTLPKIPNFSLPNLLRSRQTERRWWKLAMTRTARAILLTPWKAPKEDCHQVVQRQTRKLRRQPWQWRKRRSVCLQPPNWKKQKTLSQDCLIFPLKLQERWLPYTHRQGGSTTSAPCARECYPAVVALTFMLAESIKFLIIKVTDYGG